MWRLNKGAQSLEGFTQGWTERVKLQPNTPGQKAIWSDLAVWPSVSLNMFPLDVVI